MMTRISKGARALGLASLLGLVGCGWEKSAATWDGGLRDGGVEPAEDRAYYDGTQSALLGAEGNQLVCAMCHSVDGAQRGYPGKTLQDSAYRESYMGGGVHALRDAVNVCITGWMGGEALEVEDAAWGHIEAFLQSVSDEAVTTPKPLQPEVLEGEGAYAAAYAGGDAVAGEAAYNRVCARCHLAGITVGRHVPPARRVQASRAPGVIARKVRTSGPPPSGTEDEEDLTVGHMPFFEEEDLSTHELRDIIAYLQSL